MLPTKEKAIKYPKRDIKLGFCETCGFITNIPFDPSLHEYSTGYESTQSYSPTFNVFARGLVQSLVDRYNLHNKDIVEIGCGQGEFLTMLCEIGGNRGIGFDPAYIHGRNEKLEKNQISIIKDFYSEKYADIQSDFICCRMTLEHIHETGEFMRIIGRSIKDKPDTIVFFQVPDVVRILSDMAFWDIYYEHCSYFSPGSLAKLFRNNGFEIINLWKDYDQQYIMLGAKQASGKKSESQPLEEDISELKSNVEFFSNNIKNKLNTWKTYLQNARKEGCRVVLWGGGSKGVAFLTTLNVQSEVEYVVDINPIKHGTYMAGTGQKIVAPEFLKQYQPDIVIVMNEIYIKEIQETLDRMEVAAKLTSV
ncbi:MAG TPA: class I SAM-dependent methyltransferase [candidate division Zixibacteria bacterium]|nr:class I SAM-dependent methyltransferase [candidate division Zixibacteria bacterium]